MNRKWPPFRLLSPFWRRSTTVSDAKVAQWTADESFPYLVSFPRTGSHWLRMLMESTFGIPSLVRTFWFHEAEIFTCLHVHDMDLEVKRSSVIYLHREVGATVYSQMRYLELDLSDPILVRYWATRYALHLRKWLVDETTTDRKTVISYEALRAAPAAALGAVADHLGLALDHPRLHNSLAAIDKEAVRRRTAHDPRVIDTDRESQPVSKGQFVKEHLDVFITALAGQGLPIDEHLQPEAP